MPIFFSKTNDIIPRLNKLNLACIALFLLFLFIGITNHIWLRANEISPFWDESRHMIIAIRYADVIRDFPGFSDRIKVIETLEALWNIEHSYPPLFHLSAVALSLSLGNAQDVLAMSNIIFLAVMLFSVFKIGERLFDARVGLFAAFLSGLSPMLAGASRMFLLEFSAAAMISLGIYLLLLTENFGSRKYSLLFGLGAGLGMLTRETFLIFLIGPTIYIIYKAFSRPDTEKRKKIINLLISFAIGCIVLLPYYLKNISYYIDYNKGNIASGFVCYWPIIIGLRKGLRFEIILSLLFYLLIAILVSRTYKFRTRGYTKILVWFFIFLLIGFCWVDRTAVLKFSWYALNLKDQIGLPFLIVFLLCLPYFLRSGKNKVFLLIWIIVPYCFFTLTFFYDHLIRWQPRLTIAYLPAIALISASCVLKIKNRRLRTSSVYLIIILGLIHFFNVSFGLPLKYGVNNKIIKLLTRPDGANWWLIHQPVRDNYWKVPEILKWIHGDMRKTGKEKAVINLIVDTGEINPETLNYYSLADRLPLTAYRARVSELSRADYVISLSRPQDWHWDLGHEREAILRLYAAFKEMRNDFVLVKKFKKPDNALFIFRNGAGVHRSGGG